MKDTFPRFDMKKPPRPCWPLFRLLLWLLCFPGVWAHRTKITKVNTQGLKPPYLLLGNHNAFQDMKASIAANFPHVPNYIVAIDGFIGREWLLRAIGCICRRKFTNDAMSVRHMMRVIKDKGVVGLYPEARYSLCGTTAVLPEDMGKLVKLLHVPVVLLLCHGHHVNSPFWNTKRDRKVKPMEATMEVILSVEDIDRMTPEEINTLLVEKFQYDDFRWQKEKGVRVTDPHRADGLERVLYQCPHCKTEYQMHHEDTAIYCASCGKHWDFLEDGSLRAREGETEFDHVPDWYEWQRQNVRQEIRENRYSSGILPVTVESLPNAKAFIPLGEGTFLHDMTGFHVQVTDKDGDIHTMEKDVLSMYSVHIEYRYLFTHGDGVDLNTLTDTWYCYPHDAPFSITKMALATEELYYYEREKAGNPCPPGLA